MIKRLFQQAIATLLLVANISYAGPVDLGNAGDYTLLATGTNAWYGLPMYGNLELGSAAQIYGQVGVRNTLNMAHDAAIYGAADFGGLTQNPGAVILGNANPVVDAAFWDALYLDVKSASQTAQALGGVNSGAVNSTQTFNRQGDLSVFNISGLNLSAGHSLTLKGNAGDMFVVNVGAGGFMLGGGAAIILEGISADNVLFNMYGILNEGHVNVAAGTMKGTYIAPDAYMQLGDGLNLEGVRFLAAGISGNLQTVQGIPNGQPPVVVFEPSALLLLGVGLLGLSLIRRRV